MTTLIQPLVADAIRKPTKIIVPLSAGLAWGNDPYVHYEEKLDGDFQVRADGGNLIVGEFLAPDHQRAGMYHAPGFYAFDILEFRGENTMLWPLAARMAVLCRHWAGLRAPEWNGDGTPGQWLQDILSRGGEGMVAKDIGAPWGTPMLACKRLGTWLCAVTGVGNSQSVGICDSVTGEDRGRVKLGGGKCDRVRVGSIIKVEGMQLTDDGKIREPRLCKDSPTSWLVKF
jgi:hypothetical protein